MRDVEDIKQQFKTLATLSGEGVRVLLGCFLMLFVSQKCGKDTCTTEQLRDTSDPVRDTFWVLHFLSAIFIVSSYILEAKREKWLINNFDSDPGMPDQAMQESWVKDPSRHIDFRRYTRTLRLFVLVSSLIYLVNWLGTAIFLIGWHWNGISTLTGLLTQGVLVVQSLSSTYDAASASLKRNVPISTVLMEPVVFNKWDADLSHTQSTPPPTPNIDEETLKEVVQSRVETDETVETSHTDVKIDI